MNSNCSFEPAFMRAKSVAEYLGISKMHVWALVRKGEIKEPIRMGKRCSLFTTESVKEYAKKIKAMARKKAKAEKVESTEDVETAETAE